ncbi:hypothetical protein CEXT_790081 [Caerostris extrusa]|uniref:Uncharacterized protein n=1 Tax=Caerostris extrusa TaxID=172846 RepID=A0AAV4TI30_CAEEX|nr:hypothetical protein CEXT_790081 [Caerostris extrusa]
MFPSSSSKATFFPGDSLQRLPESAAVHRGHIPVRQLLPEYGLSGRGTLPATQCHNRDQDVLQHVHVQGQHGSQAYLSGCQEDGRNGDDGC